MLVRPDPRVVVARSKPAPSSRTSKLRWPPVSDRAIVTPVAPEYFAAFWRASRQQKYTADSTSGGYLPAPWVSTVTPRGDFRPCASSAGGQAPIRQQWRVDPPGQVAEVLQGGLGVGSEFCKQGAGPGGVLHHQRFGQAELHSQGHQLLLGPVVDVPLDPPPLGVLSGDEALSGGAEILDQPDVAKHEAGPRGQVPGQMVLRGGESLAGRLPQGEGA